MNYFWININFKNKIYLLRITPHVFMWDIKMLVINPFFN